MKILILPSWYHWRNPESTSIIQDQVEELNTLDDITLHVLYPDSLPIKNAKNIQFIFNNPIINDDSSNSPTEFIYPYLTLPKITEKLRRVRYQHSLNISKKAFKQYKMRYEEPQLIHAHSAMWAGCMAHEISTKFDIPYMITEHRGRFHNTGYDAVSVPDWATEQLKSTFINSELTIGVSEPLTESILQFTDDMTNTATIPNMVDCSIFSPDGSTPYNPDTSFIYSYIGRLEDVKNIASLIEAFSYFTEKFPNSKLYIAGDGSAKNDIKSNIVELGIDEKVDLLGWLTNEQVPNLMRSSDYLVLPSYQESFGKVCAESLCTGTPVLTTESGGPETYINDKVGIIIEGFDSADIYEGLLESANNIGKYSTEEVSNYGREKFSTNSVSNRIINEYRDIL